MTETVEGNAGNGADQPRRARSSTERSRAHRAKKKLEREAALKAEAERVAEPVGGVAEAVAGDVASTENAVADAALGPAEQKAEREAAALHEAGKAEREADATETATMERVAAVADTVAFENAVSSSPVAGAVASFGNGVLAVPPAVEWRILERPVWRPIVLSLDVQPPAHPAHPARRSLASILAAITPASILVAAVLFLAALDLGGSGLVMNARYAASLGSGEGATIQAAIGIAIDAIALVLLSAGYLLWSNGHRRFAVLAWIVWPVMLGLSLMNTIGFSATNISDALAKRSAAVSKTSNETIKASNAASDLKRLREKRDAIAEKRSVQVIKLQIVRERFKVDRIDRDAFDASVGCTRLTADVTKACNAIAPTLQALAAAQDRDKLDQNIKDAEKPQNKQGDAPAAENKQEGASAATSINPPPITTADPQAEMLSKLLKWVNIELTADDVALVRILGYTVPPLLAGLFLMFATALLAPPRTASGAR
jgi:hypothetical protein